MLDLELLDNVPLTAIPAALAEELAETEPAMCERGTFNSFI